MSGLVNAGIGFVRGLELHLHHLGIWSTSQVNSAWQCLWGRQNE